MGENPYYVATFEPWVGLAIMDSENWSTKAAVEKRLPHFETVRHDVSADKKGDSPAVLDQLGVTTARHYEYKHSNVITRPSRAADASETIA